jgi:hypothetical protein
VSEQIWPKFKAGFAKMIRDGVEHARPTLPLPLRSLSVVECSFGSAHPQFGPIFAGSKNHRHVSLQDHDGLEVQLDINLKYSTDAKITLQLGVMNFGISHIEVNGVLSLRFTPLLDEMPVFSAMQLFFLNSPEIDLRFTNVLEALTNRLVVPNVLNIGRTPAMTIP